jgi:arylsulfatase A-like enzyme
MSLASLLLQGSLVLVVLDDVGQKDLDIVSANGYSPNIDALKAQGIEYRAAFANPTCSPSRRSLFFGEFYTEQADIGCNAPTGKEPPLSLCSTAELISVESYLVGKWHLGSNPNYPPWETAAQAHGFEEWVAGTPVNLGGFCNSVDYNEWLRVDDGASMVVTTYNPTDQRDEAIALIQAAKAAETPFFLVLSLNLAHGPMHRPQGALLPPGYPSTPTTRDKFEAMIAAADTIVGAVVAELDLAEDAVIVIGDNGTPENVAPNAAKAKFSTFERGIKIPCIAATQLLGAEQGTQSTRLVHVADIYPTAAQWFGAVGLGDGCSLFGPARLDPIVCGAVKTSGEYDRCARGSRFKFRRVSDAVGTVEELYDLLLDQQETVNELGNPVWATQEATLRATLDAFEAR